MGKSTGDDSVFWREEERKRDVKNQITAINRLFADSNGGQPSNRQKTISSASDNAFDYDKDLINKSRDDTERELQFHLARTGTMGGSNDINQNQKIRDIYGSNIIRARQRADSLKAQWQAQDKNLQGALIQKAATDPSAIDINTTQDLLRSRSKERAATGTDETLSDAFKRLQDAYARQRFNNGYAQGQNAGNNVPSPTSTASKYDGRSY